MNTNIMGQEMRCGLAVPQFYFGAVRARMERRYDGLKPGFDLLKRRTKTTQPGLSSVTVVWLTG